MSTRRRAAARKRRGARPRRARPEAEPGKREGMAETIRTLAVALILALAIRSFLVQPFYVPSGSMFPTLLIGDHVFVNKFLYGIRIPGTDVRLPGVRDPARGDVVVFRAARSPEGRVAPADRHPGRRAEDFIKRIVAIPGDTIEVRDGTVYVNGAPQPRSATGEGFLDPTGRRFDVETEDAGRCRYQVLHDPRRQPIDRAPLPVEPGRYFVMGDNRNDSYDSRFYGTIRLREIRGPAGLLYWSWDWNGRWRDLLNPLTWWRNLTQRTRWGRIGSHVGCRGGTEQPAEPPGAD